MTLAPILPSASRLRALLQAARRGVLVLPRRTLARGRGRRVALTRSVAYRRERYARQRHAQRHHHRRDQQHHALPHTFSPPFAHSRQQHWPKERRMEGEAHAKAPPLLLCVRGWGSLSLGLSVS